MTGRCVTLFLAGDVMPGRGIDRILPHPGDPRLHERHARSAELYVRLAEAAHGPVPRRGGFAYVWGEALAALRAAAPDLRIVNLETSVTTSDDAWPKGINYRMHPANVACLTAAGIDCCGLANNHVLDWGEAGLLETLATLRRAGIGSPGRGATRPRPPLRPSCRCPRAGACWSMPSPRTTAACRRNGARGRIGPASPCCPI